jgi:hypothetical protein
MLKRLLRRLWEMANRDRSQGFGFVYMDLKNLLSKMSEWTDEGPVPTFDGKVVNFNKDSAFTAQPETKPAAAPVEQAPIAAPAVRTPVEQIRQNLDRLQTLHHRIHVMLEELNQLGGRKKDPTDEN